MSATRLAPPLRTACRYAVPTWVVLVALLLTLLGTSVPGTAAAQAAPPPAPTAPAEPAGEGQGDGSDTELRAPGRGGARPGGSPPRGTGPDPGVVRTYERPCPGAADVPAPAPRGVRCVVLRC
ncbi:hypothetical protein [Streptomyces sp. SYSU K217416]